MINLFPKLLTIILTGLAYISLTFVDVKVLGRHWLVNSDVESDSNRNFNSLLLGALTSAV